jgi:putative colanic acid biosynthesis acetyltransferase WcaB
MKIFINMLKQDYKNNKNNPKAIIIIILFRLTHFFATRRKKNPIIWCLGIPLLVLYRIIIEWVLGVELPAKTKVGSGLVIYHGQSLVINDHVIIGNNVRLRHNTTIGTKVNKDGTQGKAPLIGNNVDIGANVVIIGEIIIGENSVIGAGSVVVKDIPSNSIVVGNPARVIKKIK